jgi:hypothetical protein
MPEHIQIDVLLDEIIYLYKVETSLQKSQRGEGISIESFREKAKSWIKSTQIDILRVHHTSRPPEFEV